jgi:putative sigma-54 modulation protein
VHAWKEGGRRSLAGVAAEVVVSRLARPDVDAITFVPGASDRTLWRGHHAAEGLARRLAAAWQLPCGELLGRDASGRRQRGLARAERRRNAEGSFRAVRPSPPRVCVIDDVYTTGATLAAAAAVLVRAGASRVEVVTFGRTPRDGVGARSPPLGHRWIHYIADVVVRCSPRSPRARGVAGPAGRSPRPGHDARPGPRSDEEASMRLQVKGRNLEVTPTLHRYASEKLGRLDRHLDDTTQIELELAVERNPSISASQVAEATVWTKGPILRARESSDDMRASIDLLADKLERQVKRYREKRQRRQLARRGPHRGTAAHEEPEPADELAEVGAPEPTIVKTKQFAVKPMPPDEAVLQLELIGHDFFMFRNVDSGEINVVYRRKDGTYGLLEPTP